MRWTLEIVQGSDVGRECELDGGRIVLGRDEACEILVDDRLASRNHARLILSGDSYLIEDLGSTNHTRVNGQIVAGQVRLKHEDVIGIGSTQLLVRWGIPGVLAEATDDRMSILSSIDAHTAAGATTSINAEVKLHAILKITEALGATLDLGSVLSKILDGLLEIFPHADRALVLLFEDERLVPKASRHRHRDRENIKYSSTIVKRAIDNREAIVSTDVASDDRLPVTESMVECEIRSVMCVPLLSQEMGVLGVIQLDARSVGARFDADDAQILASVARQASISVEYAQLHKEMVKQAQLRKEMDFAREVQHRFLPQIPPESRGYRFWAYYSAAGKVGGDYYDFVQLPNGNQAVLLADVCGKGVPAALMMAKLSAVCKVALLSQPDRIADAMTAINNEVCEAALDAAFVTLVLCVIDPNDHEITLANAGHMSPLIRRVDGSVDAPADREVRGYPLGFFKDSDYKTGSSALAPGESVLLYSDGISEAMNAANELYTDERVCKQMAGMQGKAASEIGEALLEDVRCHTGECEQSDDVSLVVFQRT